MTNKVLALSRNYQAALRRHLKQDPAPGLDAARRLGIRAVDLGLETLDLARIHEEGLCTLVLTNHSVRAGERIIGRAGAFFAEAITPIEKTHRGARQANIELNDTIKALNQRTGELADSVEELKREITQRKAVEESLRASERTSGKLLEKSLRMQEELRLLSRQLLSVQEEERRKISRELHDVIAQTLTGINVRLAALKSESNASTRVLHRKIATTQRLVEKSVDIVHRFACELRPTVLDDLGLIPALQSFMKSYMAATGVRVALEAFNGIENAGSNKRTVLYRVAQEALANVARHARASRAKVTIRNSGDVIRMEIKDNGQGFDTEAMSGAESRSHLGLLGMRERVEMVDGTFCVASAPGKPTTVVVEIPSDGSPPKKGRKKKSDRNSPLECP